MKKSIVLQAFKILFGISIMLSTMVGCFTYPKAITKYAKVWTESSDESKEKGIFVAHYDALPFEYSDSVFNIKLVFKEAYTEWEHCCSKGNVNFYKNSNVSRIQNLIAIFDTENSNMAHIGIVDTNIVYANGTKTLYLYNRKCWTFGVGGDKRGNYNLSSSEYIYGITGVYMSCGAFDDTIRIPIRSLYYYEPICGNDKTVNFGELVFVRRKDSTQQAESTKVVKKNEPVTKVESVQGRINDYEYVDLGLSVKWATHNVGTDKPEEVGAYYAWGEKKEKKKYSFDNCKTIPQKPKNEWERVRDMDNIGGNEKYDVARAKWGAPWRLPSKEECEELKDKCKWEYTTLNSIEGYKVTGPNGNSIFLPLTDYRKNKYMSGWSVNGVYTMSTGVYWTSQPEDNFYAYFLGFSKKGVMVKWGWSYYGIAVRPVFKYLCKPKRINYGTHKV